MSIHFHPIRVKEVRRETPACVSVLLDIPEELHHTFSYQQGQSLTIRTTINGEEVRRTYSLCSSPLDNEWRVAIKKVEGGIFSSYANELLQPGDTLEVMQPVGRFYTDLKSTHRKRYVAFAAGSGITPVLSLIKTTLATEPLSHFTLVYGNRSRQDIIFFEELEALKNKYMDRFQLIHILSREQQEAPVLNGRINAAKLQHLDALIDYTLTDDFFICGPESMIFEVKEFLESRIADKRHIHFELFTTPGQTGNSTAVAAVSQQAITATGCQVHIKLDGRSIGFTMPAGDESSVLDAALSAGADLPYACKGGVCCTCKARLLEGKVHMDVHWGLEEEEVKQGFILTCQSHPLTPQISVDFDVR